MLQDKKSSARSICTILTLGIIVYTNTLLNSFHFDDYPEIINNVAIKNIFHLKDIWIFWPTRFVAYFSFALNYCWGGSKVLGYHLVSLAIHLGASLLVWQLTLLTLDSPAMRHEKIAIHRAWIALLAGLIFLVHPLQTQPINYIFQRSVLLAAFFYLGALILFINARSRQCKGSSRWKFYYGAALGSAILSVYSKETAISLPLMICLYEAYFLKGTGKFPWKMVLPFFVVLILLPLTWISMHPEILKGTKATVEGYAGGTDMGQYILTQLKVMVTYLRLLILPIHQRVEYDYTLVQSILEPMVLASAALLLFILAMAFRMARHYRLMSLGILWFFITLLPESSFWPNQDLIFEHRLYLPLMGFCIFLTSALFYLIQKFSSTLPVWILVVLVLMYSFMAFERNRAWHDELSLWDDAVKQSPKSARAYLNRGAAYQSRGDLDHAMQDYNMVIGLGPITAVTLSNRGTIFRQRGDFEHALANFNLAIKINPNYAGTYVNRGLLYRYEGKLDLALWDANKAVELMPHDADAHMLRGRIYELQGDLAKASEDYQRGEFLKSHQ